MAKFTRSNSLSALAEGQPDFTVGLDRFSIGITSREGKVTYHLHLSNVEAQLFAAFVAHERKTG